MAVFYLAGEVPSSLHRGAPPRVGSWSQEKFRSQPDLCMCHPKEGRCEFSSVLQRRSVVARQTAHYPGVGRLPRCYRSRLTGPSAASASRAATSSLLRLKIAPRSLHHARNLGFQSAERRPQPMKKARRLGGTAGLRRNDIKQSQE